MSKLRLVILLFLLHSVALISAQGSTNGTSSWQTLNGASLTVSKYMPIGFLVVKEKDALKGNAPLVIARGGFSGYFLILNNVYLVNGVSTPGWFSVDFTLADLATVSLNQGVYSRSNRFDGNLFPILTVQEMFKLTRPPGLWLNIQHDVFYTKHNLSMRTFVLSVSKSVIVNYISSPEVAFLRGLSQRFKATKTKLIFRFLEKEETDPSTNQTYGSLLNNLTFIKTFASGILVPKDFINDIPFSYNYSYDPIAEVLNFIDNDAFSVDGVLSDFPITPSAAIDCFAHIGKMLQDKVLTLLSAISNPYSTFRLSRNPAAKTAGKLVSLSDFLSIAKEANSLSGGVLIGIEHVAFLVKVGLSVTDAVLDTLNKAGYDNVTTPRVMIQSTNSSVLKEFKEKKKNYELVYRVDENIRDASDATIEDIKKFATSVVISKDSVYPENKAFITGATDIFISQAWDFFSDATVEINSFVMGAGIDGVITSFPQTAASYKKNRCLKYKNAPSYMSPVQPGSLMQVITSDDMPPALAPYPVLTESDVAEPPLQEVAPATPASSTCIVFLM
ncbi:hypothetical protein AAG906_035351 [Vitis piasezkii]